MRTIWRLLFLSFILSCYGAQSQVHKISGAEFLKPGQSLSFIQSKELTWSSVSSECLSEAAPFGLWVELKLKSTAGTFEISNPNPRGKKTTLDAAEKKNIEEQYGDIVLYLGEVVQKNGRKEIQEIRCSSEPGRFVNGAYTYSIGSSEFSDDGEYFVLVSCPDPGLRFDISLSDSYTEVAVKEEPSPKEVDRIQGRVRNAAGIPQKGISIDLLDINKKRLKSTATGEDGTFQFERLPIDQPVLTQILAEDSELDVDIYLIGADGAIKSRSTKVAGMLYGFEADKDSYSNLKLLTETDWQLNVATGKLGVTGRIVDASTYLFGQKGVAVDLFDEKQKVKSSQTDEDGRFEFIDLDQGLYTIKVAGDQSENYSEMVMVDDLNVAYSYSNSELANDGSFEFKSLPTETVELQRMEERDSRLSIMDDVIDFDASKSIVLKNVLFETGSSDLLTSSNIELDKISVQLNLNPSVRVRVVGHTDDQGTNESNLELSKKRAERVMNYLISSGISASRLEYEGFGENRPIARNDSEEGRRKNRRVELIKIE